MATTRIAESVQNKKGTLQHSNSNIRLHSHLKPAHSARDQRPGDGYNDDRDAETFKKSKTQPTQCQLTAKRSNTLYSSHQPKARNTTSFVSRSNSIASLRRTKLLSRTSAPIASASLLFKINQNKQCC